MLSRLDEPFRDAPNLVALTRVMLEELERVESVACTMLDSFNIDTAVGEQLDTLGYIIGLPRTVCNVERLVYFGFTKDGDDDCCNINSGLCSPFFVEGKTARFRDYTFADDEEYRKFLIARAATRGFDGTVTHYQRIVRYLFDGTPIDDDSAGESLVWTHGAGKVTIRVPRDLTEFEISKAELYKQVLPFYGGYNIKILAGDYEAFALTDSPNPTTGLCTRFAKSY